MNMPTLALIDKMLSDAGSDSTCLGSASMGLIAAPFTPSPTLKMSDITEASFGGYARQAIGSYSSPFTGSDGLEYIEGSTLRFQGTSTVTVNTIYGLFITPGSDTTKLFASDQFQNPIPIASSANQITITPRFGLNPLSGLGMNVISS